MEQLFMGLHLYAMEAMSGGGGIRVIAASRRKSARATAGESGPASACGACLE